MTYVADTREKFLTDALLTSNRVLSQLAKRDSKYARDLQKISEIEKQRKQFTQNMVGKTELHMKSVLFERENLQMELEDAFEEIDTLKQQVEIARQEGINEGMHTQMDIRQNPYEDFEELEDKKRLPDQTFEFKESPFEDDLGNLQMK